MDGKIIVVTSGKGGVGKTTATASIGAALAMEGKRVAVVDMDIGLRNLHDIVPELVEPGQGLIRIFSTGPESDLQVLKEIADHHSPPHVL